MMDRWLVRYTPPVVPRLRLFCLPYAGAGASLFASWPELLPDGVELNAVQLPGRENRLREEPFTRLQPLLEVLSEAIRPYLDLPFALLGYSFGALLAFELARCLRRDGAPLPQHLFVLGRRAPHLNNPEPPVHRYSDPELVAWMRDLGGTPTLILEHPELLPIFLPILRADLTLHETYAYRPEAPLDLSISAFGGLRDSQAGREELEAWKEHTNGRFNLRLYPGGHFFLKSYQAMVVRDISAMLM
jgi:medium-chain acyl-[acyl-carrier-protein] hydrolase